jgi:DNA-binding SARP family transcriptional activator
MRVSAQPTLQDISARQSEPTELYRVYFFGPFRAIRTGQPPEEIVWRRNKARSLLKWFLLNPGRTFSADQLIKSFWPDIASTPGSGNLHVTINYLRHVLEPDLPARQESTFVRRDKNNFYWFELNETWWADIFDVDHHCMAAKEAEQCKDLVTAVNHYRKIAEYCSLGFLPEDTYEDMFISHRRQYDRIYAQVLERLISLCSQLNLSDDVFAYSQQALLVDPYCEPAIKAIINLCLHQGNVSGALRKLDDFQRLLKEDLGIEPGKDILALRKGLSK